MRGGSWGWGCEARGARETEPIGRGVTRQKLRPSNGSSRGLEAANKAEIGDDDGREMSDFKGIKWTIDTVEARSGQYWPRLLFWVNLRRGRSAEPCPGSP
jgi:hypothetical protein